MRKAVICRSLIWPELRQNLLLLMSPSPFISGQPRDNCCLSAESNFDKSFMQKNRNIRKKLFLQSNIISHFEAERACFCRETQRAFLWRKCFCTIFNRKAKVKGHMVHYRWERERGDKKRANRTSNRWRGAFRISKERGILKECRHLRDVHKNSPPYPSAGSCPNQTYVWERPPKDSFGWPLPFIYCRHAQWAWLCLERQCGYSGAFL